MINLSWVLPKFLRPRMVAEMPPNEVEEAIAKAGEGDRMLRAVLTLAHEQWEQANFEALNENMTPDARQYKAGYAAGTMDFLMTIRRIREAAKKEG